MNPINVDDTRSAWRKQKQKSGELKIVRISSHEISKPVPVNPPTPQKQETPRYGIVKVNPIESEVAEEAIDVLDDEYPDDSQEAGTLRYERESLLVSIIRGVNAFRQSIMEVGDNEVILYWPPSSDNIMLKGEKPKQILAIFNPAAGTGRVNPSYHKYPDIIDGFVALKNSYETHLKSKLAVVIDPKVGVNGS